MRLRRATVLLLLVASMGAVACPTSTPGGAPGEPSPSPTAAASPTPEEPSGQRIAVVLPSPEVADAAEVDSIRSRLVGLRTAEGVGELRLVRADAPRFTADVAALLADEDYDLVCVVGAGAADVVTDVAAQFRSTRFCATPASVPEVPGNVVAVDVRVEELAFLAGAAAAVRAPDAPAGLVAGEHAYAVARQRTAYERGVRTVAPDAPSPLVALPVGDRDAAHQQAISQYAAGVTAIYTQAGAADAGVLDAAVEATPAEPPATTPPEAGVTPTPAPPAPPPVVVGRRTTLLEASSEADDGAGLSEAVLMTVDVDLAVGVRLAVERLLDGWEAGQVSIGLAERAVSVSEGASADAAGLMPRIERLRDDVMDGSVAVLPPPPEQ